MTEKSQSVRSQRSFSEHMKTLYQNIDTLVYAAEITCSKEGGNHYRCPDMDCAFRVSYNEAGFIKLCKIDKMRGIIGDHTKQDDIETVELTP